MIYVGDIGTMIKLTIDKGCVFEKVFVHTSYNKKKYRMDVEDIIDNHGSYTLPKEATLHAGHIFFEVITNKGKFKTKKMVVNIRPFPFDELKEAVQMGEDWYHVKANFKDSYEEDEYFIIN